MEEEASQARRRKRSYSESYSLPEHRRDQKISMGVKSSTYTDERRGIIDSEEDSGDVLLFHGIILRSQLVEMLKHKIFFEESQGVSQNFEPSNCYYVYDFRLRRRRKCHTPL